jgi:hypothetical protein
VADRILPGGGFQRHWTVWRYQAVGSISTSYLPIVAALRGCVKSPETRNLGDQSLWCWGDGVMGEKNERFISLSPKTPNPQYSHTLFKDTVINFYDKANRYFSHTLLQSTSRAIPKYAADKSVSMEQEGW